MGDERNIRSKFYEKVGLREVEEKRALEALLKEQPVDERKLAYFCQRSVVPAMYRILVWKLLLHVKPRYAESQEYVREQQTLMYEELWNTMKSLKLRNLSDVGNDFYHDQYFPNATNLPVIDEGQTNSERDPVPETPSPEHHLLMWLMSKAKLLHNPREQLKIGERQQYLAIVRKISSLFDTPLDTYLVCSSLWSLLSDNHAAVVDAVQESIGMLRKENDILHRHLMKIGLFSSTLLMDVSLSVFCDVFPLSATEKILDKVIAGAFNVFSYVIVALLLHLRQSLASTTTVEGVRSLFGNIRKEESVNVVTSALDQWHKVRLSKRSQQ